MTADGPRAEPGERLDSDRSRMREPSAPQRPHAADRPPAEPRRPPRAGRARGVARLVVLVCLVALLALGAAAVGLVGGGERTGERVRLVIPTGAGVSDIARLLERERVVSSALVFEARATLAGRRGELRPGSYVLERGAGYGAALDTLATGPPVRRLPVVNVTIPEGRSRREIAPVVRRAGLRGSYAKATLRSRLLRPKRYGAGRARDLEGFLFPATYELRRRGSVRDLVRKQLSAFKREFARVDLTHARKRNLTPYDVLIIASMVEREAQIARERPLIASVIYNRLRSGMPLGIDATVRFVTGNWKSPLKQSELAIDSAYNTRTRAGLPPGPIGNPGIAAIRAAAKPASTRYLFYVVKPGACGEHAFSATAAEFERDTQRYDAARARRGGKSPTSCPS